MGGRFVQAWWRRKRFFRMAADPFQWTVVVSWLLSRQHVNVNHGGGGRGGLADGGGSGGSEEVVEGNNCPLLGFHVVVLPMDLCGGRKISLVEGCLWWSKKGPSPSIRGLSLRQENPPGGLCTM